MHACGLINRPRWTYQTESCRGQSSSRRCRQEQQPAGWGSQGQQNLYHSPHHVSQSSSIPPTSRLFIHPNLPFYPELDPEEGGGKVHTASNRGGEAAGNGRSGSGAAGRSDGRALQEHGRRFVVGQLARRFRREAKEEVGDVRFSGFEGFADGLI